MKVSLCLTHYNRANMIRKAYEKVIDDERIAEVCISDDHSTDEQFDRLLDLNQHPKIKVRRNHINLGVGGNKSKAIEMGSEQWCIIFDSDNVMDKSYLDAMYAIPWERDTIYAPTFAKPHFDYRIFQGEIITNKTAKKLIKKDRNTMSCFLNTGNYLVNRSSFLDSYEHIQVKGADSIYILYLWLRDGKKVIPVKDMHYEHLIHSGTPEAAGSYYQEVAKESEPVCKRYEQLISEL